MIQFKHHHRNKKGFSMVELVIVIAIFALITAFVVPQMANVKLSFNGKSDERTCQKYAIELKEVIREDVSTPHGRVGSLISYKPQKPASLKGDFYYWYDGTNKLTVYPATEEASTFEDAQSSEYSITIKHTIQK